MGLVTIMLVALSAGYGTMFPKTPPSPPITPAAVLPPILLVALFITFLFFSMRRKPTGGELPTKLVTTKTEFAPSAFTPVANGPLTRSVVARLRALSSAAAAEKPQGPPFPPAFWHWYYQNRT